MISWVIAIGLGVAAGLLQYGRLRAPGPAARTALAVLRALALMIALALLLDAPMGRGRPERPWVFVDASLSMTRDGDSLWQAARDSARRFGADSVFAFGDSLAPFDVRRTSSAGFATSSVSPAIERAISAGRPAVILTDGELSDAASINDLVNGSRVVVLPRRVTSDAAVVALDAPRAAVAGDTIEVHATIASGGIATTAGTILLRLDERDVARTPIAAMSPWTEREVVIRVPASGGEGVRLLRAIVAVTGDADARNDTLGAVIEVSRAASAVFVSSSPDQDSRFALTVLRGVLALPTRGYLRVAPGLWREEGTLAAVAESDVRRALRDAPIAVLHGDTAIFGSPAAVTRGPFALLVPADSNTGEWYPSGTPASPLTAALASLPIDSLPPVIAGTPAPGDWSALEVRRGRSGSRRSVVSGRDQPRRRVTVTASGLWRWRFRGGISADAYASLWGSIFDWLAEERADKRAVLPVSTVVRAGEPVRWQRGSASDTLVRFRLRRRGDTLTLPEVTLRYTADVSVRETPAPPPGVYDADVPGGRVTLLVNQSAELLPARPRVSSGAVGRRASATLPPGARGAGWLYVLLTLLLCGEWIGRRRAGLR